jgi:hypothetical protein
MKKLMLICIFGTSILTSCLKDEYDIDNLTVVFSPEIAVPLITTSIEANDVLSLVDSTMLTENSNNLLEFVYSDTVYSVSLNEFIDIPDKIVNYNFNLSPIILDDVSPYTTTLRLDSVAERIGGAFYANFKNREGTTDTFPAFPKQNAGESGLDLASAPFTTATFSQGVLKMNLKNDWPIEIIDVEIVLKRVSDNVAIDTLRFASVLPGQSLSDSVFLAGKTVENSMKGEFISIAGVASSEPVLINGPDPISMTISGYDMVIVSGTAVIEDQEVLKDTIIVDIDLGLGEELETIVFKNGSLDFDLTYQVQESAKLYIELPYATKNGSVFLDSVLVGAGPVVINESFDLTGYSMDLTRGSQGYNAVETRISAKIISSGLIVPFDTSNTVSANVSIVNIEPYYVYGYFGSKSLSMALDTNDFEIGEVEILKKMSFADPEVTLGFHNTLGLPMEISNLDLIMKNGVDEETLSGLSLPFTIASGNITSPGVPVISNLVIDASSTNIEDGINLWPNKIITGFTGDVNPLGKVANFALDTSRLDVTFALKIPLYFTLSDYEIRDTLELDSALFEKITRATIRVNVENEFPLEGKVGLYIVDANYNIMDSLTNGLEVLIAAATVDASGETINVAEKQSDLVADEEAILNLRNSAKIIVVTKLGTGNNGSPVKIYSTHSMNIKLGLMAKVNLEIDTNTEDEE